jgi:hypothetical protein
MNYPLLLRFTGTTIGRGFAARVSFTGRFLGSESEAGWWLYGVSPSAIAESGTTLDEANAHLREALREALAWFASEAPTFEAFKVEVERFVLSENRDTAAEWQQAVETVRAGKLNLGDLPVWAAAMAVTVDVARKSEQELSPLDNSAQSELGKPAIAA